MADQALRCIAAFAVLHAGCVVGISPEASPDGTPQTNDPPSAGSPANTGAEGDAGAGGGGGGGGSPSGVVTNGLPCEIFNLLQSGCVSCHATHPVAAVPATMKFPKWQIPG